ncbi:hypothetical protein Q3G72_023907 [Acer saccharum]|nr:hypothetical protein Q3G72_023907 [Acer saccharum]
MSKCGKVSADVEIKSPGDKFHEMVACKPYLLSKCSPEAIQTVDLLEGQWGKQGYIACWNFSFDGKPSKNTSIAEELDFKNKSGTWKTIEGNLTELYKNFKIILQVISSEENGSSLAKWTLEYEKLNDNVPDPTTMLQILVDYGKRADAYLTQALLQCN